MTAKEIDKFKRDFDAALDSRRLLEALDMLTNVSASAGEWRLNDRVATIRQSYSYLLKYFADGVADPGRDALYRSLISSATAVRDLLVRSLSLPETPTLYYNTVRSLSVRKDETFASLYAAYLKSLDAISPFKAIENGTEATREVRRRSELIETDIFNRLWTTYPLSPDDAATIAAMLDDEAISDEAKALFVSGITLGLLEFFDERRFDLLLDGYKYNSTSVSSRAMVGYVIAMMKYDKAVFSDSFDKHLAAVRELPGWYENLAITVKELVKTADTERISARLRDEIMPKIKKMSRDISERLEEMSLDADAMSPEDNPDLAELLSDSKMRDTLKEFGEMQEQGSDVFLATFANLKQFPFFNDVANWFMPYRTGLTVVSDNDITKDATFATLIDSAPYICDGDKYSMILSVSMMPSAQREMMMKQFDMHSRQFSESLGVMATLPPAQRKVVTNNYILSIYRFYKLFRRKGEFYNPFANVVDVLDNPRLAEDFSNPEELESLAARYIKLQCYDKAIRYLTLVDETADPSAARSRQLGYAYERLGLYDRAALAYEQSDLLDGTNRWTLRRYIYVLLCLGQYDRALAVCARLEKLDPQSFELAMTQGNLYAKIKDYDKAVNSFLKAEFIDEASLKPARALAGLYFLMREYEQSRRCYDRLFASEATAEDCLGRAHLAWAENDIAGAVEGYKRYCTLAPDGVRDLVSRLDKDTELLAEAGVDVTYKPLMIDAIINSLKS